jgi:thioredoxin-like negative regulator of GroEL
MPSRAQLEELLKAEPDDVFLRYALAMTCVSEGDLSAGLALYDDVLRRDPDHVPAHFQKARALADAGRVDEARAVVDAGIAVAARVGDAHAEREMREFLEFL